MDEDALVRKLEMIEREVAQGGALGMEGCRAELAEWRRREADIEFRASVPDPTSQRVLLAWCNRYGLEPYRKPRQRESMICVRVPDGFMREKLWPRVEAMAHEIEFEVAAAVTRVLERWSGTSLGQGAARAMSQSDELGKA